ncbi:MAG: hypothetical protein ACE5Q6_27165 [Dehalococcoidia bacterium]
MSKFLDLMDRIKEGAPTPLGFGAARAEKLPGMVLVGLVAKDHAKGVGLVSELSLNAAFLSGVDKPDNLKKLGDSLDSIPWGAYVSSLSEEQAEACQENGCDLVTFALEGTPASAVASDELARFLVLDPGVEEAELRALASLPIDGFLLPMTGISGAWTLQDLATIGSISRRVDKYILIEVSQPPGKKELEALRDIGVQGLVLDVGAVSSDQLSELKTALLEMPRPEPRRRGRTTAILPSSVFSVGREPAHEEEEEEDDE